MEYIPFVCSAWASLVVLVVTINSTINFLYASKMVFHVMKPPGHSGPLYENAIKFAKTEPEIMINRRIYAVEAWLTSWVAAAGAAMSPWLWYMTFLAWPV